MLETRRGVSTFVNTRRRKPKRDRLPRMFVTRVLADAAAAGFTARELLDALADRRKGALAMPRMVIRPKSVRQIGLAVAFGVAGAWVWRTTGLVVRTVLVVGLGLLIARSPRVAQQWERGGRPAAGTLRGPARARACSGSFRSSTRSLPGSISASSRPLCRRADADLRHRPVNVDAVLFWMVYDPEKAALEVQDYRRPSVGRRRRRCATSSAGRR